VLLQFAPSGILLAEPQNDHYDQWNGDEHAQGNLVGSGELHQAKYQVAMELSGKPSEPKGNTPCKDKTL
jgi:hypothetical protein